VIAAAIPIRLELLEIDLVEHDPTRRKIFKQKSEQKPAAEPKDPGERVNRTRRGELGAPGIAACVMIRALASCKVRR
jgi:hypothetical protein